MSKLPLFIIALSAIVTASVAQQSDPIAPSTQHQQQVITDTTAEFARLDSNGDGQLSKAEADQQKKLIGLVQRWPEVDKNNDDLLSQDEFAMFLQEAPADQQQN